MLYLSLLLVTHLLQPCNPRPNGNNPSTDNLHKAPITNQNNPSN
uniref:Uncharacterized protein n=1 Tax=Picea glauca TaxID=3330 RepID=A0A101LXT0_PICGL|nr:hypothetical protein ABT39_MTgene6149 [Picea glauca]QHR88794.1 hypothetical protein Q903MT_gene2809 [Picea sitchensis]